MRQTLVCLVRGKVRTFPTELPLAHDDPKATCQVAVTVTSITAPTGVAATVVIVNGRATGGTVTTVEVVHGPGAMDELLRSSSMRCRARLEATEEVSATAPAEMVPTKSPVSPSRVIESSDRAIITSSVCVPDSRQRLHMRSLPPLYSPSAQKPRPSVQRRKRASETMQPSS